MTSNPGESTPLLSVGIVGTGSFDQQYRHDGGDDDGVRVSFRRKSVRVQKMSLRQLSGLIPPNDDDDDDAINQVVVNYYDLPVANPLEGLAPLFPGGIQPYFDRGYIPYRPPSLVKSVPAFAPYRRMARHRSFYLWWTNEFRHWWKSSRLLVRLGGLYVYSFDPTVVPNILLLDPERRKTIKQLFKFAKALGQGGQLRIFVKTVKPFTRSMRLLVGAWRWLEAAPCRRGEVGVEEAMAFVGNRVSRMVARGATDLLGLKIVFPFQRFLFRADYLSYPEAYHPIVVCVCLGILRAVSPFAASFQGSRAGRVLTRRFFSSAKNRWLPVQRIGELNLLSDDCQEKDEANQTADLVVIARKVATALGRVQVVVRSGNDDEDKQKIVRQYEALMDEGFRQCGAGSGGYAVYQFRFKSTTILLHVTPYGPSITDVMPFYLVLEFETSVDSRQQKWANSLANISSMQLQGPQVLEGYAYQGAFFSPHHFAELKEMYDKQLLAYESACKKLPIVSKKTRHGGPPRDLPTLKKFLEAGKRARKRKKNIREYNELQKVVTSVAKEILALMKKEKKMGEGGHRLAPKGVILYFEGLDCSGKSSTGGLVQTALEQSGYDVGMRQYNRPPTVAQRMRPWMDRFEAPSSVSVLDLTPKDCQDDEHIALVWDRGPAGDFVYGNLNDLSQEEKKKRYAEFMAFDRQCRENDILFLKLFFITNRDSIAKTLGKRLAQKKMAKDLTTWLQACRSRGEVDDVSFEGLEAISAHIDPTDFVAFNCYERNLRIFSNFVMNTDSDANPWVVVNTGDRYAARKALMSSFRQHLHEFQSRGQRCSPCRGPKSRDPAKVEAVGIDEMMKRKFKSSWRHSMIAWVSLLALLVLAATYKENTNWDQPVFRGPTRYNITALLEGGNNDDGVGEGNHVIKNGKTDKTAQTIVDDNGKEAKAGKQVISEEKPTPEGKTGKTEEDEQGGKAISEEEPSPDVKTGKSVGENQNEKEAKAGKNNDKNTLSAEGNVGVEPQGTE